MTKVIMENFESIKLKTDQLKREVLSNEIEGVKTNRVILDSNVIKEVRNLNTYSTVLIFLSGTGTVELEEKIKEITEIAIFVPSIGKDYKIESKIGGLEYLEVLIDLRDEDKQEAIDYKNKLPYFTLYSECNTYKEVIKSPKTVSRNLVKEEIVPRFCMGSVETTGEDLVAAHKHPGLEQHFYGLSDNNSILMADDATVNFGSNVFLHIPLGSSHSVKVESGNKLHYLWLDYFVDKNGLEWVKNGHIHEEK